MEYLISAIVALLTLLAAYLGYHLRTPEVTTLRRMLDSQNAEIADLRDFFRLKHNLPSVTGEIRRMTAVNAKPDTESEKPRGKFADGVPNLFEQRQGWTPAQLPKEKK